jgi:4-oxalocrotonate tautomerase
MPLVQVSVREGRPAEAIRKMISSVTAAVAESLNAPAESIRVIVTEVPLTHWATGDVTLQEKQNQSAEQRAAGSGTAGA